MATALTAVVQQQYARVRLELTFTTVTSATVVRVHADGTTWPVRSGNPALVASTTGVGWVGYDHEAPLDQVITYRATSTQDPTVVTSNAVTVASDPAWVGSMIWLTHPLRPSLSRLVVCTSMGARTRKARSSILPIRGRADPIAVSDVRLSPSAEMTLLTTTLAETTALAALLADGATLCVRCPGSWGQQWFYASFGDLVDDGPAGYGPHQDREWKLPYQQVAAPAGVGSGPIGVTYADVLTTYGTYDGLRTARSTPINANPNFETDLSDWLAQSGATIARVNTVAHEGSWSMRITPPGAVASVGARTSLYPTVSGRTYTASAWLYAASGWSDARACIDWYDAAGVFITTGLGSPTVLPAATWTQSVQPLIAPAGAVQGMARVRIGGTPSATDVIYVDEAKLVELFTYSSILT